MRFYILIRSKTYTSSYVTDFEKVKPINRGNAPKCEACGKYIGLLTWLPPYRVNLELWGEDYGDIARGPGSDLLVSDRFLSMYRQHGFTGLSGFDLVEIMKVKWMEKKKRNKLIVPIYNRVLVKKSQAVIDHRLSGLKFKSNIICEMCREGHLLKKFDRVILEENTWDGKDIFEARGLPGTIIVTNNFKQACEEAGIRNAVFVEAEKYCKDYTFGKKT